MKLGQNFVKYFVRYLGNGVSRKILLRFIDIYTSWNKLWRSFFLSWTGFKQDTAGKGAFTNYVNLLWLSTAGVRGPNKAFFHRNPNLLGLDRQFGQINFGYFWTIYQHPFWYCVFHYSTIISTKKLSLYIQFPKIYLGFEYKGLVFL